MTGSARERKQGWEEGTGREGESAEVNSELKERWGLTDVRENCIKRWRWWEMRAVDRTKETGREER